MYMINRLENMEISGRGALLLIRHAERPPIPEGSFGIDLPITPKGGEESFFLGKKLGEKLRHVRSSPVRRCMETASKIVSGSRQELSVTPDAMLGRPGAFICDESVSGKNWDTFGHKGVRQRLFYEDEPMEGFYPPGQAALNFLKHMALHLPPKGFITLFVTHDIIIAAAAVRLLNLESHDKIWPDFLSGLKLRVCGQKTAVEYYRH
ncbi:hypothetical protein EPICR_50008 [Candidatus Desulfarcum epimagneticum]|uniref:Histidine phosphatase family protein n=1 Tax=uncultured Desulfobacteraceae bacterium TaxID=218296 RepID=A0A484HJY9_9BACT|nr:hypothetical protein EPICR_50008 [uncultured Desulfobacteraceae bacterium]